MKTLRIITAYLFVASVMATALVGTAKADSYYQNQQYLQNQQMIQNQQRFIQQQAEQNQWQRQQAQQQQINQQLQQTFGSHSLLDQGGATPYIEPLRW